MLLDLLVPLAILPDNVLVTLDTQEPHVINVSISFAFSFLVLIVLLIQIWQDGLMKKSYAQ